jgi:hypothetical protein
MNAGVAKLIPSDLVYSRTAPNVAHVSSEQAHQKINDDRATKCAFRRFTRLLRRTMPKTASMKNSKATLSYRAFADERERPPHRRIGVARRRGVVNVG